VKQKKKYVVSVLSSKCYGCGEDKPASSFYRDRSKKTGLMERCKLCCGKYVRVRTRFSCC
jgi:hypothetical protein